MRELTDGQRSRLPGYVLSYVADLERERDDLRRELHQRESADTNVWQRASVVFGVPDKPLLPNAEIRFDVNDVGTHDHAFRHQRYVDVRHSVRDRKIIELHGARPLILHPSASNHIYVEVENR